MMELLTAVVYFTAIGAGTKSVVSSRSETPLEWIGTSVLYGVGTVGLLGQIAGALAIPLALPFFVALFAAGVVAVLVRKPWPSRVAAKVPVIAYAAMFVTLIPIGVLLLNCVTTPVTDYDGRVTWVLKARAIAREQSITGPFFQGLSSRDAHSHYPLLMPVADAALLEIAHEDDDRAVKPAYALIALGFLLALCAAISAIAPVEVAWLITACVAWLPQFAAAGDGGMLSAYSDVPLIAFTTLALLSILRGTPVALGVELSFVACVKNEGIVVVLALLLFAVLYGRKRSLRRLAVVSCMLAVTVGVLSFWRSRVPLEHDENYGSLILGVGKLFSNWAAAALELLSGMADVHAWGLLWPMTVVAFYVAATDRRSRRRVALAAAVSMGLILAAYISAYAVTNWSVSELAVSSANRLLLHCVPFAAVLLALGGSRFIVVDDEEGTTVVRRPLGQLNSTRDAVPDRAP
jgi:hypothetical protein